VRSADGGDTELSLEPNVNPAARAYQQALLEQGIPATAFEVDDIAVEFERLKQLGVQFTGPPKQAGPVSIAILNDTCGNLIQLYQPPTRG
jgi:predicted enzyme related to lactoylglutathione lyase